MAAPVYVTTILFSNRDIFAFSDNFFKWRNIKAFFALGNGMVQSAAMVATMTRDNVGKIGQGGLSNQPELFAPIPDDQMARWVLFAFFQYLSHRPRCNINAPWYSSHNSSPSVIEIPLLTVPILIRIVPAAGHQANGERLDTYWEDVPEETAFRHTFIIGTGAPKSFIDGIIDGKYKNLSQEEYNSWVSVLLISFHVTINSLYWLTGNLLLWRRSHRPFIEF